MDFVIQTFQNLHTLQQAVDDESEDQAAGNLDQLLDLLKNPEYERERRPTAGIVMRCLDLVMDKAEKCQDGRRLFMGVIAVLEAMKERDLLSASNVSDLGDAVPRLAALRGRHTERGSHDHSRVADVMNFLLELNPQAAAGVALTEADFEYRSSRADDRFRLRVMACQNAPANKFLTLSEDILLDCQEGNAISLVCKNLEYNARCDPDDFKALLTPRVQDGLRGVLQSATNTKRFYASLRGQHPARAGDLVEDGLGTRERHSV